MLQRLWEIFCGIDIHSSGYISVDDYVKLINLPRSSLTDAVMKIFVYTLNIFHYQSHVVILVDV